MTMEELEREMVGQPIKSLQFMLRRLSRRYPFLPVLVPDGVFGERTLEAVMLFQRELHPPVTGAVDEGTWRAIQNEWLDLERELAAPRTLRGVPPGVHVEEGREESYLYPIQAMFQSLSKILEGVQLEDINGVHSGTSVDNIRWLQRHAMLDETGEIDRETWDMLTRLYELFAVAQAGKPVIVQDRGAGAAG